jgi:predicted ArsR family transcriptional regulator
VNWQLLARANTHPLRVSILEVLSLDGGRTLSPKDLSLELQAPLSTVNYHVTELAKAGLLEMIGQRQVRGAIEHFYRAVDASPETASSRARRNGAKSRRGVRRRGGKRTTGLEPATSSLGSSRSTS